MADLGGDIVCRLYGHGHSTAWALAGIATPSSPVAGGRQRLGHGWQWRCYLEQGQVCVADGLTVVYTRNLTTARSDFWRADCGDETVTLFLRRWSPRGELNATVTFWQVGGVLRGTVPPSPPARATTCCKRRTSPSMREDRHAVPPGSSWAAVRRLPGGADLGHGGYQSFYTGTIVTSGREQHGLPHLAQDEDGDCA
ncbi:MAG: hypothetical protein ACLUHL_12055 [Dysosmobacter welbionis]